MQVSPFRSRRRAYAQGEVVKQGGFTYVLEDEQIGLLATKTFAAHCPGRTHVLSGGAGSESDFGDSFISSSYPFDDGDSDKAPDDGWKTKFSSFDASIEITPTAVCSRVKPAYRSAEETAGPGGLATDPIPCGPARAVVHGGLRGPTSLRLVSSFPSDNAGGDNWLVVADNISNRTKSGTGYAVCSADLTVTYASSSSVPIPANTQQTATSMCPPSAPNPIGGGPVAFGPVGGLRLSRTSVDSLSFDGWYGTLEAEGSAGSFSIWADCVPSL